MLTTNHDKEKNILTCVFSGKMDSVTSQSVSQEFDKAYQEAQSAQTDSTGTTVATNRMSVVFDLAEVPFVASAFLRICLQAAKKAGTDRFTIINVSPSIKKILKIAGMDQWTC